MAELGLLYFLLAIAASEVARDPRYYILKEKANQKIFERRVVQQELLHLNNVGHLYDGVQPVAIFVVGQTGSGKTRLGADLFRAMQGRQPARLIADVYKAYHPKYKLLIKDHPKIACAATSTDARKWLNLASRWLIKRRIDVIIESACRTPDDVTSLMSDFHIANYRVQVAIMAVPDCLSLLGTMEGVMAVANFVDNSPVVSDVVVVRRNNLVAFQNPRGIDGLWVRPVSALASLDLERTRPLPDAEHESFAADCLYVGEQRAKKLKGKKQKKGKEKVTETTLEEVEASLAGLMSIGGRLSASFPVLKRLDIEEWVFGDWDINDVKSGAPEESSVETVLPRNSILQESARVQPALNL